MRIFNNTGRKTQYKNVLFTKVCVSILQFNLIVPSLTYGLFFDYLSPHLYIISLFFQWMVTQFSRESHNIVYHFLQYLHVCWVIWSYQNGSPTFQGLRVLLLSYSSSFIHIYTYSRTCPCIHPRLHTHAIEVSVTSSVFNRIRKRMYS